MEDSQKPLQEASGTRRSDQSESKLPIRDGLCSSLNGSREDDVLEARTRGECMRVARHRTANEKVEQRSTDLLQTSIVAQPSALYNTSHGYPFRQGCHPHRRPFERSVPSGAGPTVARSSVLQERDSAGTLLTRPLHVYAGTRFRPLSLDLPKPLFSVGGRPIIWHSLVALSQFSPVPRSPQSDADVLTLHSIASRN